ncbi:hypothetical protein [Paucibacter sp. Y2R2-4]|uniref:hypothetical protein n=1 Tax=Paucibacter sp. Y2R2-4 TaxID=2893553 RepID=UPI0021E41991|nr:hypothetical protein [Paucibacter sp. Y2R2-4]MCV2349322.1 hypothetical protein [Paucibacter sp. Y2R2-4]
MQTAKRPYPLIQRGRHAQRALALDPAPEQVLEEAEALRCRSSYWRQRYRSLDEVLADPRSAQKLLICARGALIARWRQIKP